jgi:hypothetical protein
MHRRRFVNAGIGLVLASLVAGCPGLSGTDGATLVVQNKDGHSHTYEIDADEDQTTAGRLAAGESTTVEHFVPYQDYRYPVDLRVTVDDETVRTATIGIHTDVQQFYVQIQTTDSVEIGPDRVYSPTPH